MVQVQQQKTRTSSDEQTLESQATQTMLGKPDQPEPEQPPETQTLLESQTETAVHTFLDPPTPKPPKRTRKWTKTPTDNPSGEPASRSMVAALAAAQATPAATVATQPTAKKSKAKAQPATNAVATTASAEQASGAEQASSAEQASDRLSVDEVVKLAQGGASAGLIRSMLCALKAGETDAPEANDNSGARARGKQSRQSKAKPGKRSKASKPKCVSAKATAKKANAKAKAALKSLKVAAKAKAKAAAKAKAKAKAAAKAAAKASAKARRTGGVAAIETVKKLLEKLGVWFHYTNTNTLEWKRAQSRQRVYMIGVLRQHLQLAGISDAEASEFINQVIELSQMGWVQETLEDILLPESHDDIRAARAKNLELVHETDYSAMMAPVVDVPPLDEVELESDEASTCSEDEDYDGTVDHDELNDDLAGSAFEYRWQRKHSTLYKRTGIDWPPPPPDQFAHLFPGLMELSRREYEIVYYLGLLDDSFDRGDPTNHRIIDLSQTIERVCIPKKSLSVCMTPHGRFLSTKLLRLLIGEERLRLQHIYFNSERWTIIREMVSSAQQGDLSGNAFNVVQYASHALATQLLLAMIHHCIHGGLMHFPLRPFGSAAAPKSSEMPSPPTAPATVAPGAGLAETTDAPPVSIRKRRVCAADFL